MVVTDTDVTQVSLLFFLDKCRSIYFIHIVPKQEDFPWDLDG